MGIGLPYYTAPKKIDPFPLSLVIRIRLKDGGKVFCDMHQLKELILERDNLPPNILASINRQQDCLILMPNPNISLTSAQEEPDSGRWIIVGLSELERN